MTKIVPKSVSLKIEIELPTDHKAVKMEMSADGFVSLLDEEGNDVTAKEIKRVAFYPREKGPKYQSLSAIKSGGLSVGGLHELAALDHFVVIDTNTNIIDGVSVSVAYFLVLKLVREDNGFRLVSHDGRSHAYEFHSIDKGNPELLAILKVANDIKKYNPLAANIAFINDSDISNQNSYAVGELAIYGDIYLPPGFNLWYASADTGQELLNKIYRICDKASAEQLKKLKSTGLNREGMLALDEDPDVLFRYKYFPNLKIDNPFVQDTHLTENSTALLTFIGAEQSLTEQWTINPAVIRKTKK